MARGGQEQRVAGEALAAGNLVSYQLCFSFKKNGLLGASLVAQWLRIHLPANAGDTVRALVREDPTCRRATKPVRHNY